MLLLFFSSCGLRKCIVHHKCIHFIALVLVLTICNYAAAQVKFQLCRRLSQAICKQSSLFAKENKIQPPLKYSSNFPPSNSPSCVTVQVISDRNADRGADLRWVHATRPRKHVPINEFLITKEQVCKKSFVCTGLEPNEPRNTLSDPDPNQTYEELCDAPFAEAKIVGGIEACPHEFPYQVRLLRLSDLRSFCGGSLLSPNYVLTAAHCVRNVTKESFRVILGDHDRLVEERTEQRVKAEAITTHKDYASIHGEHDIALIKVTPPLQLNQYVQPILLPRANYDPFRGYAVASGWGRLEYSNPQHARKLRKVVVPIVTFEACNKLYDIPTFPRNVTEKQLCTGDTKKGGIAPCLADSGGAFAQKDPNGSYIQIGIVSWSISCADPELPTVYIKVSRYLDWIRTHMT